VAGGGGEADKSVSSVRMARGMLACMDLEQFCELRPRLFHLTAASNVDAIRAASELVSASVIYRNARREAETRDKRREHAHVSYRGRTVHIRDQNPLHEGNCAIAKDWSFGDVVKMLNDRVFFWPGDKGGPIEYGRRHFLRYADEKCKVIVIPTRELIELNSRREPQFCSYNSGSPRCTNGRGSPRGPHTFVRATEFGAAAGSVREVVWEERVKLPERLTVTAAAKWH
jgi:hypothetical protein